MKASSPSYAVVVPSNRVFDSIKPLLVSLINQTQPLKQLVIVWDRYATQAELDTYVISVKLLFAQLPQTKITIVHHLSDPHFFVGKGASYVRNYGRKLVKTDLMMFIDDDNVCPEDMCEQLFGFIDQLDHPASTLVAPVQYDDTKSVVRPALAKGFSFVLCRPKWLTDELTQSRDRYVPLMLASSNCLAGTTALFAAYPFDETVPFVYEDLLMVARMYKGGVYIFADTRSHVLHHHGKRTKLAQLYANTPDRAYYKAKHRLLLVHEGATSWQLVIFYAIGFVGQLGWIWLHVMIYAPVSRRGVLAKALWKGTCDGIAYIRHR